jgi:hypothetical protein
MLRVLPREHLQLESVECEPAPLRAYGLVPAEGPLVGLWNRELSSLTPDELALVGNRLSPRFAPGTFASVATPGEGPSRGCTGTVSMLSPGLREDPACAVLPKRLHTAYFPQAEAPVGYGDILLMGNTQDRPKQIFLHWQAVCRFITTDEGQRFARTALATGTAADDRDLDRMA